MDSFNEILSLYESRKIKQLDTAQKMILKLASARGKGKQATTTKISNISQGIKHIKKPNPFIRPKTRKYYITANIDTNIEYISTLKKWKNRVNHVYKSISKKIEAENEEQAKAEYIEQVKMGLEADYNKGSTIINGIEYVSFIDEEQLKATPTQNMMMKMMKPIEYAFINADVNDEYNKNNGFCVFDTFVGTYSKYIKKLNQDRFVEMCYNTIKNDFDNLDASIN